MMNKEDHLPSKKELGQTPPRPESEIRLDKLGQLKKLGINPYPSATPEHITIEEARSKKEGAKIAVVGRLTSIRKHGKIAFLDLTHEDRKIQLFSSIDNKEVFELIDLLDTGDYIWVSGELFTTKAGELTIKVKTLTLLSKSLLPIPEGWNGLENVEARYRQRALDFKINPEARQIIRTRAKIISTLRDFLERHGFIEITTPVLQPIPGGATAKPFVTKYNVLGADFYLRVSDELYLKRLVVGGFERVFEIGPDFRNEGISHMHNPEFTMCEFYWAYQTYDGLMKVTQQLVQELVKTACGSLKISYQDQPLDFSGDFTVVKFVDLLKQDIGIDIEQADTFVKLKKAIEEKGIKFEGQKITVWSELVDELFKKVTRPKIVQPTFIIDYPLETKPLAKIHHDNPKLVENFYLVAAGGFELVNAYSELNDPIDQEARFKEQAKMKAAGWDEAQVMDENYIEALKYGMPPTAGWGMGIDRLTMIVTDQHSIKEVIPFPTLRPIGKPRKS